MTQKIETAYFAGGCFWCMQPPFDKTKGVVSTTVGYMGGTKVNPTYKEVCTGKTGHTEAIKVEFDPTVISYLDIVRVFWQQIDPTMVNGQFCDKGSQYRTGIYPVDETQSKIAQATKKILGESELFAAGIATEILPATTFYAGEIEHQHFYQKNPNHYQCYREDSGRDAYVKLNKENIQNVLRQA